MNSTMLPPPPSHHRVLPAPPVQHTPAAVARSCRCRAAPRTTRLPNGLTIQHNSTAAEVQFLYAEQPQYVQHHVHLQPGDVVLDAGANVGLLTMLAAEAVGAGGRVVGVEPAPATASVLAANVRAHAAWCAARGVEVAPCTLVRAALGDAVAEAVQLTTYPGAAGWASLSPDDGEVVQNMQVFVDRTLLQQQPQDEEDEQQRGFSAAQRALVSLAAGLKRLPLLRGVTGVLTSIYVRAVMLRGRQVVAVPVETVSSLIDQHQLKRVDLLKIDVERAELQVLRGVRSEHWPLVRQVVLEVHDTEGRLAQVVALLEAAGLQHVVVEQAPALRGSNLHMVWATRAPV